MLAQIYRLNEVKHAHDPYDYFRSSLKNYGRDLDSMLVRMFTFFEEINGTPVLLSMLVLCLKHQKPGQIELPTTITELYQVLRLPGMPRVVRAFCG